MAAMWFRFTGNMIMNLKTRLEKLQREAPPAAVIDGEFIQVIRWEGPEEFYRLVDGERMPCAESDIPPGYFPARSQMVVNWEAPDHT